MAGEKNDFVAKEVCDERIKQVKTNKDDIRSLYLQMRWFYILAISTLVGIVVALVKG